MYRPVVLMEGAIALSSFAGEPSGATVMSWTTPAVAAAGEAIPNGSELEAVPESVTVMVAVPGVTAKSLEMVAFRLVGSPNCVGNGDPFQVTTEDEVNPEPFSRSVNPGTPATTQLFPPRGTLYGDIDVRAGGGALPPPPPPPPFPPGAAPPQPDTSDANNATDVNLHCGARRPDFPDVEFNLYLQSDLSPKQRAQRQET